MKVASRKGPAPYPAPSPIEQPLTDAELKLFTWVAADPKGSYALDYLLFVLHRVAQESDGRGWATGPELEQVLAEEAEWLAAKTVHSRANTLCRAGVVERDALTNLANFTSPGRPAKNPYCISYRLRAEPTFVPGIPPEWAVRTAEDVERSCLTHLLGAVDRVEDALVPLSPSYPLLLEQARLSRDEPIASGQ